MRKNIVFIFGFIFAVIMYVPKGYAYQGGIIENKLPSAYDANITDLKNITDNNLSTSVTFYSGSYVYYDLPYEYNIGKIFIKNSLSMRITFYDRNMIPLLSESYFSASGSFFDVNLSKVKKVQVAYEKGTNPLLYEFDIYRSVPPTNVTLSLTKESINSIYMEWKNPTDNNFDGIKIYLNGVLKETLDKTWTSYSLNNLIPNTTYTIKITTFNTSGESSGVTTTVKTLPLPNVTNLELFPSTYSILAQWINPTDSGFIGNDLYLDGNFITSLDKDATSYKFNNLNPNTSYTVKVVSKFSGGYSSTGQTATAKTTIPLEDVTDLSADAKYDRVKLSWTRPNSEFFSHAKIYRKKVEQKSFWDQIFGTTSVSAETTSDGYTPMFETNGTYWTDLTVTPETTYSYKVTSVNIAGDESQGVTVETTTPSEPVPVLSGVATTQNENGDYVVTWTSPTKGTVKLLIEGREYAQVDAATKQIVVRKKDMKTDFFGAYAATLIPIGEYGTKGQAVNVPSLGGKIDFPLSFQDFMETTISILAWVAPFILLSLIFIFWRPIFNFIKKVISNERRVKQ
ncbi:fibronectin type III domain-containing protein [Anoxybacillus flavithermus]|uniref:fibronectin type III domain-containing protein n=1 Tax=Anoxybacillus flavithermus TaxID=33934 RepID=UPI00186908F7|nr:fibronectin type III domain-containing protein [Anoxybacillus flavithermus]MBE2941952.1 fibronectin type III domain-containing protein [Anoxybacillus flavithermus]MBE2950190.1 fibronectin type III domain-containing protein [Anoxybacillus flavithermus]MBE2953013.1 fibronectin type III domain-containing protein [Anoxybacillus flavithermus]MBE2958366.1 fibronectin type III domain-containing protein [Anoxybacillus flavithermus]